MMRLWQAAFGDDLLHARNNVMLLNLKTAGHQFIDRLHTTV